MRARWEQMLEGRRTRAAGGAYDVHVSLAHRYQWTQTDVDAQDADYIDELMVFLDAVAAVEKRRAKKQKQ